MQEQWFISEKIGFLELPEVERELREQLLLEIQEKIDAYTAHTKEYNRLAYQKTLAERGVVWQSIGKASIMKMVWTKLFAMSLTRKERKSIEYEAYRWKIFSCGNLPAKTGVAARNAFNEVAKEKVFVFYQNKEEGFVVEEANLLCAKDLDLEEDVFVFDDVACWTYVHTHENTSYFYYRKEEDYPDGLQLELEL